MKSTHVACMALGCTHPVGVLKFCARHYEDHHLETRFWSTVRKTTSCWTWSGRTNGDGYGLIDVRGNGIRSHRLAYELARGPIPDGLEIDHLCRNRACVNPDHLEPVDGRTNTHRGFSFAAINARKTHCVNGHEFTPDNTYTRANRVGRDCRACMAIRQVKCAARRKIKSTQETP